MVFPATSSLVQANAEQSSASSKSAVCIDLSSGSTYVDVAASRAPTRAQRAGEDTNTSVQQYVSNPAWGTLRGSALETPVSSTNKRVSRRPEPPGTIKTTIRVAHSMRSRHSYRDEIGTVVAQHSTKAFVGQGISEQSSERAGAVTDRDIGTNREQIN